MSLTLRLSTWIRRDVKHSDCEIDLKFRTTLRGGAPNWQMTRLPCLRKAGAGGRKPARMANQISDIRQTGGSAGTE
jgi:hypothetical protein